jgi:heme/copper-type cytochrome/quinol oxidase subunit 2
MPPAKSQSAKGVWIDLIRSITTPLGVFVLALLIIEATAAVVLTCSKLSEEHIWEGFLGMLVIFVIIVVIVTLLTIFSPKNLLYGKEEHSNPALDPAGTLRDDIEALIIKKVKAECLNPTQD